MREGLLEFLRCLGCGSRLDLRAGERDGEEVLSGALACARCGGEHPVLRGIPRILRKGLNAEGQETASRFGEEWALFDDVGPDFERNLLQEYIHPESPEIFRGARVLECGCGSGRNIIRAAEYGAKAVVGVDLGSSVEVAWRKSRHLPNVHVIQCDILAMPLMRDFDVVFSAGVLHHLPEPEKGFRSMLGHLRKGGVAVSNVYSRENNAWLERYVTPLRLSVTTKLPSALLYYLSLIVSAPAYLLLVAFYKPLNVLPLTRALAARLFYNDYAYRMSRLPFRATWVQIFDQLTAPVAAFISREEIAGWVARAGLKNARYHWRNKNSWNFSGVK